MSVIINASTASGLVMTSDLSGNLQLQNNGVNLPMGGVAPAFSAYNTSAQSITSGVATKVIFQNKVFDTNNNFDNTTNYRFTPTVAGYYQVNGAIRYAGTTPTAAVIILYKTGSQYAYGTATGSTTSQSTNSITLNELVYLNGSTDYIELYGAITATSPSFDYFSSSINCRFSACLVRGA
jgi:hypothetical protein